MKKMIMVAVAVLMLSAVADDMPFWYNGDSSVTNRVAASSVQVSTAEAFDMRLFVLETFSILKFSSNPLTGFLLLFK